MGTSFSRKKKNKCVHDIKVSALLKSLQHSQVALPTRWVWSNDHEKALSTALDSLGMLYLLQMVVSYAEGRLTYDIWFNKDLFDSPLCPHWPYLKRSNTYSGSFLLEGAALF